MAYERGAFGLAADIYSLALLERPRDAGLPQRRAAALFGSGFYLQVGSHIEYSQGRMQIRMQVGMQDSMRLPGFLIEEMWRLPQIRRSDI